MLTSQTKATDWLWALSRVIGSSLLNHYCSCVCERRAWVQLWFSSGHLHMTGLICLRLAWILHQHCYTSHSPQPDPPLASSLPHNLCLLFCATPSFLLSHPQIVVTVSAPSPCRLPPSLSPLFLSRSLSRCVCRLVLCRRALRLM